MNEIRFRSWDFRSMSYNPIVSDGTDGRETAEVWLNHALFIHDDVLMQFTGVFDVNEEPIYEDDIIRYETSYGCIRLGRVIFEDGAFGTGLLPLSQLDKIEVVGNVYENPELSWELNK